VVRLYDRHLLPRRSRAGGAARKPRPDHALIFTLGLIVTGARFVGPLFESLKDTPDYGATVQRLRAVSRIDLGLFGVVFTCMILMRFL
jgi:hypothetical protein